MDQPRAPHLDLDASAIATDPWVRWLLDAARTRLGTTIAWVSEFTEDTQTVLAVTGDADAMNVHAGMAASLEGSFCVRVLTGQLPPVVTSAARDPRTRDLAVTAELNIGSYVGAPIRSPRGGRPVGMLCCLSRDDGVQLGPESARFLEFLAELIGQHLSWEPRAMAEELAGPATRIADVLRTGAVQPVFQPVVDLCTGRPVGYEALSRFVGADTATLFSDAARTGQGLALERLAVRTALAAARNRPLDVPVAVNLSPEALLQPDVQQMLLTYDGGRIGVEITEHAKIEDYAGLMDVRRALRAAGVLVSVDDTGAGYASLRHVLQLEPDVIKIDAGIIGGVDGDRAKRALVTAIKAFADEIGAATIAEGVETAAERDVLAERGIEYGQGWLWGRPQPFDDLAGVTRRVPAVAARSDVFA